MKPDYRECIDKAWNQSESIYYELIKVYISEKS